MWTRQKAASTANKLSYTIDSNDQLIDARDYRPLILTQKQRRPHQAQRAGQRHGKRREHPAGGLGGNEPAVLVIVFKQPGANVIETVDRVRAVLPQIKKWIPPGDQNFADQRPDDDHPRLGQRRAVFARC